MAAEKDQSLSLSEEITLRRVALGVASRNQLPAADLERLELIGFVKLLPKPSLTPAGTNAYRALPKAIGSGKPDFGSPLVEALSKAAKRPKGA